jgi:cytochrome c oxidase subunit 2
VTTPAAPRVAGRATRVAAAAAAAAPGHRRRFALVLASCAGLAGCLPAAASDQGKDLSTIWQVFIGASIVVAGIVYVLTTWAILRYRARGRSQEPGQTAGNTGIEILWTAAPLVTVLALFIVSYRSFDIAAPAPAAANDVQLDVTAFRWGWQFTYRGTGVTLVSQPGQSPEVVLPVGANVHVSLTARDVIHAFFVPAFLYKRDATPGHTTAFDIRVSAPGVYPGECAEYCGVLHAAMPFQIRGVTPDAYATWLAQQSGVTTP